MQNVDSNMIIICSRHTNVNGVAEIAAPFEIVNKLNERIQIGVARFASNDDRFGLNGKEFVRFAIFVGEHVLERMNEDAERQLKFVEQHLSLWYAIECASNDAI